MPYSVTYHSTMKNSDYDYDELVEALKGERRPESEWAETLEQFVYRWLYWTQVGTGKHHVSPKDIWEAFCTWAEWNQVETPESQRDYVLGIIKRRVPMRKGVYRSCYTGEALRLGCEKPWGGPNGEVGYGGGSYAGFLFHRMPKRLHKDVDFDYVFKPPTGRKMNFVEKAFLNKFILEYYNNKFRYKRSRPEGEQEDLQKQEQRRERFRAHHGRSRDALVMAPLLNGMYSIYEMDGVDKTWEDRMIQRLDLQKKLERIKNELTESQLEQAQKLGLLPFEEPDEP